jgi:hypothetical protein
MAGPKPQRPTSMEIQICGCGRLGHYNKPKLPRAGGQACRTRAQHANSPIRARACSPSTPRPSISTTWALTSGRCALAECVQDMAMGYLAEGGHAHGGRDDINTWRPVRATGKPGRGPPERARPGVPLSHREDRPHAGHPRERRGASGVWLQGAHPRLCVSA